MVEIRVSPRPKIQLFEVCISFPATSTPSCLLRFPVWTPGSYLVREHARHLQDIHVETPAQQPLPFERLHKNHLCVHNQYQPFRICYSVWAAELSVRTNHLDDSHGFFNGAAMFFFSEETRHLPHHLYLQYPTGWLGACALPLSGGHYVAQNFDELVDAPVEMGPHAQPFHFSVLGVPHEVVWWGKQPANMHMLLRDMEALCTTQAQFFGKLPFERYLFIVHMPEKGHGGLEHRASCALLFGQENFSRENGMETFLCLASHEYFHAWNVKQITAQVLQKPDYENECYTRMLWALEGGTCYYEKLLNFRTGLLSEARLLQLWTETLAELATTPGRLKMPLEEASLLAWTHHYRPNAHSRNTGVSYYVKGEVVCLLLDLYIRQLTNNQRGLDDVFLLLWQRVQQGETLAEHAFEMAAVQVACAPMEAFFNQALRSTEELDFSPLQYVGLEVFRKAQRSTPPPSPSSPMAPPCHLYLGVGLQGSHVAYVEALGPAYEAGIQPGDEFVALDGQRLNPLTLSELLAHPPPNLPLHFFRQGRLCQTQIIPRPAPVEVCLLRRVQNPSPSQQHAFQEWLTGSPATKYLSLPLPFSS
ncbi:MAG: PDZ domain-containing protein [Proteobacteria bacterium]|nr:PDZ domain-containing protein [Pseudomonadota bacterium]